MPTYDYRCDSCGARFDVWQKITDDPVATCPTCGGPVHRLLHPVGLLFKGAGFYSTDNRGSSSYTTTPASDGDGDKPATPSTTESAKPKDASPTASAAAGE